MLRRRALSATTVIIALTVAAWVVAIVSRQEQLIAILGGFIPARAGGGVAIPGALPIWLTPLSSTLIHAGAVHIAFNMMMLFWCGRQIEQALGARLVLFVYVVGAYAAAAAQWALDPDSIAVVVGASGAISAVVAIYALVFSEQKVRAIGFLSAHVVRALWLGAAWLALQALVHFGFGVGGEGGIAIGSHIGGFLAGLLLARPLLRWRFRHGPQAVRQP